MLPIFWREFTATAQGSVWKAVTCTHCSCEYLYQYEAKASGNGSSLYGLDNDGARRRAAERAEVALARHLEQAVYPVPCPDCGSYQPDMAAVLRRQYRRWLSKVGWVLVAVAALGCIPASMFTAFVPHGPDDAALLSMVWAVLTGVAALGLICLVVRWVGLSGYDPNFGDPEERVRLGREIAVRRADLPHEPEVPVVTPAD